MLALPADTVLKTEQMICSPKSAVIMCRYTNVWLC